MRTKLLITAVCLLFASLPLPALKLHGISSVVLLNFSSQHYDIAGHRITVNTAVYEIDDMSLPGTVVAPGTTVTLDIGVPEGPASVTFWGPGGSYIIDFMQYGAAGNPYENEAVMAGRWIAGEFVPGSPPFESTTINYGDIGASYWQPRVINGFRLTGHSGSAVLAPNPVGENSNLDVYLLQGTGDVDITVTDARGALVLNLAGVKQNRLQIETSGWARGLYHITAVRNKEIVLSGKVLKQ